MSKMVTARELAERTGYSVRFFQDMAGRCEWARQPAGPKGKLFFDLEGFEKWWQAKPVKPAKPKGDQTWRQSTKGTGSGGRRLSAREKRIENLSIQSLRQRLKDASARGSSGSTPNCTDEASESTQSEKLLNAS